MRTMLTSRAGAPGTKRLLAEYGEDLVCVRYRYDEEAGERLKTVKVVVGRVKWNPKSQGADEEVRLRLTEGEDLLRRSLLLEGSGMTGRSRVGCCGQWRSRWGCESDPATGAARI